MTTQTIRADEVKAGDAVLLEGTWRKVLGADKRDILARLTLETIPGEAGRPVLLRASVKVMVMR